MSFQALLKKSKINMYLGGLAGCDLFANCKQSGIYFCCGGCILLVN